MYAQAENHNAGSFETEFWYCFTGFEQGLLNKQMYWLYEILSSILIMAFVRGIVSKKKRRDSHREQAARNTIWSAF